MFLHCDLRDHTATISTSSATGAPAALQRFPCFKSQLFTLLHQNYIYRVYNRRALVETLSLTLRLFLYHLAIPFPTRITCSVPLLGLPALQQGDFNLIKDDQRAQRGVRDFEDQIALAVDSKSQVCYEIVWFCNYIIERIFVG